MLSYTPHTCCYTQLQPHSINICFAFLFCLIRYSRIICASEESQANKIAYNPALLSRERAPDSAANNTVSLRAKLFVQANKTKYKHCTIAF